MINLSKKQLEAYLPKIELVPINDIVLNPKNPRTITERKFTGLVKSLESFWQMIFLRPLILDPDGVVLGGNQRLLAGRKIGFKFMPCIKDKSLSDQQRAEFTIKDNIPFGDWNLDDLANNWNSELIVGWGMSLPNWNDLSGGNDMPEQSKAKKKSSPGEAQAPTFAIILKSDSDKARQKYVSILQAAGLEENKDYYLM